MRYSILVGLAVSFLLAGSALASIPQKMNYQGYLTNSAGLPVTASVQMKFALYDVPSGGTPLWTETQNVSVNNGYYSTTLGNVTPLAGNIFEFQLYLGVTVGSDPEMTPRQPLAAAAYAFSVPDRSITAAKMGEACADGQILLKGTTGWRCGDPPQGPAGPTGMKGDKGDPGIQGPAGPQGPPGTASAVSTTYDTGDAIASCHDAAECYCPTYTLPGDATVYAMVVRNLLYVECNYGSVSRSGIIKTDNGIQWNGWQVYCRGDGAGTNKPTEFTAELAHPLYIPDTIVLSCAKTVPPVRDNADKVRTLPKCPALIDATATEQILLDPPTYRVICSSYNIPKSWNMKIIDQPQAICSGIVDTGECIPGQEIPPGAVCQRSSGQPAEGPRILPGVNCQP